MSTLWPGTFHRLDKFCKSLGLPRLQGRRAVVIPTVAAALVPVGEATVEVNARAVDVVAVGIQPVGGAPPRSVTGPTVVQTVGIQAGQYVYRPIALFDQGVIIMLQRFHQILGSIHQQLAVPIEVVFPAVNGKGRHQNVAAIAVAIGFQLPPCAAFAIDNGFDHLLGQGGQGEEFPVFRPNQADEDGGQLGTANVAVGSEGAVNVIASQHAAGTARRRTPNRDPLGRSPGGYPPG